MFICNFKVNKNIIIKLFFVIGAVVAVIFCIISFYKIFKKGNEIYVNDRVKNSVYEISANNYTNVLKAVHDNLDTYVGQKIHFTGYVYMVPDIHENEFILARDMIISSNLQTLVVGFLCKCDDTSKLKNELNSSLNSSEINAGESNSIENSSGINTIGVKNKIWVEIEGCIEKGDYYGEIPIINISKINKVEKPDEEFVYPPDSSFVPTAVLY